MESESATHQATSPPLKTEDGSTIPTNTSHTKTQKTELADPSSHKKQQLANNKLTADEKTTSIQLTEQNWTQWLLSNRQHFSKITWAFLVHSTFIEISEQKLTLGLPQQHIRNLSPSQQEKIQQQITNISPQVQQIELQEELKQVFTTLNEQLKQQIVNDLANDENFITLQKTLDLKLIEDSIKVY